MMIRYVLCLVVVALSWFPARACHHAFGAIYAAPIVAYPAVYPAATLVVPTAPVVAQPVVAPLAAPIAAPAVAAVAAPVAVPTVAAVAVPSYGYGALAAPVVVRQRVAVVAVRHERVFVRHRAAAVVVRAPAVRVRVR